MNSCPSGDLRKVEAFKMGENFQKGKRKAFTRVHVVVIVHAKVLSIVVEVVRAVSRNVGPVEGSGSAAQERTVHEQRIIVAGVQHVLVERHLTVAQASLGNILHSAHRGSLLLRRQSHFRVQQSL